MLNEELEFAISQYLDGQLPADEVAALQNRLAGDPEAAALFEQYRKLDVAIKATSVPAVDFSRLSQEISDAIADEEQASRMRIGNWMRTGIRIAVAAVLLVGLGLWMYLANLKPQTPIATNPPPPAVTTVVHVEGPAVQKPAHGAVAVADIEIGQSPKSRADFYAVEDMVSTPSRIVMVASESEPGQDSLPLN